MYIYIYKSYFETYLNPNLLTLIALGSFFGGANLGVDLPVGTTLLVKALDSALFPLPSMLANRRAALGFEALDSVGLRRKPKDIATPLVNLLESVDRILLLSLGLRSFSPSSGV